MVPCTVSATDESVTLDTQGKYIVGYFIENKSSSNSLTVDLEVSIDGEDFHEFDTIEVSADSEEIEIETLPWRYVKLNVPSGSDCYVELTVK